MRRVVITGIGIVSCIGNNKTEVLDSLLNTKYSLLMYIQRRAYGFCQCFNSLLNLGRSLMFILGRASTYQ